MPIQTIPSDSDSRDLREKIIFSLLANPNFVPSNETSLSGDRYSYSLYSNSIIVTAKRIESYITKGDFCQDDSILEAIERLKKEGK